MTFASPEEMKYAMEFVFYGVLAAGVGVLLFVILWLWYLMLEFFFGPEDKL